MTPARAGPWRPRTPRHNRLVTQAEGVVDCRAHADVRDHPRRVRSGSVQGGGRSPRPAGAGRPLGARSAQPDATPAQPGTRRRDARGHGSLRNPASRFGGAEGSRTPDPKTASLVLSQLSYSPTREVTLQGGAECCQGMVPGAGFEPARPCGQALLRRPCIASSTTPAHVYSGSDAR